MLKTCQILDPKNACSFICVRSPTSFVSSYLVFTKYVFSFYIHISTSFACHWPVSYRKIKTLFDPKKVCLFCLFSCYLYHISTLLACPSGSVSYPRYVTSDSESHCLGRTLSSGHLTIINEFEWNIFKGQLISKCPLVS